MRAVKPCGTLAAYKRHKSNGEQACDPCKAANAKAVAAAKPTPGKQQQYVGRGELAWYWDRVALPDANGCMLWLGSKSLGGYGRLIINKKPIMAHRVALLYAEGPPADPERCEAAHSCRNTHCVAPLHLRWATHAENMGDKLRDGTHQMGERNHQAKLTDAQVIEIRTLFAGGGITKAELARKYEVAPSRIWLIVNGLQWSHLGGAS